MPDTIFTTCGSILVNPLWTEADNDFFDSLGRSRGFALTYEEKEAYFQRFGSLGTGPTTNNLVMGLVGDNLIMADTGDDLIMV